MIRYPAVDCGLHDVLLPRGRRGIRESMSQAHVQLRSVQLQGTKLSGTQHGGPIETATYDVRLPRSRRGLTCLYPVVGAACRER